MSTAIHLGYVILSAAKDLLFERIKRSFAAAQDDKIGVALEILR